MFSSTTNNIYKVLALTTLAAMFASTTSASEIDWSEAHSQVVHNNFVAPYRQLANSTQALAKQVAQLCEAIHSEPDTTQEKLTQTQNRFKKSYLDWAKVQHITIGPMAFLERRERIQYWPDKHKVTGRQLWRLLAQINEGSSLTLEQLQGKSVALQGLPVLERMLFSEKHPLDSSRCLIAIKVTENLYTIAKENYMAWISAPVKFAQELLEPHPSLGIYPSQEVIAEIFFNQLTTQLLIVEKLKLERVIKKGSKVKNKPRELEAWRSGLSLSLIRQNLLSLQSLYLNGFHWALVKANPPLADNIQQLFNQAITQTQSSTTLFQQLQKEYTPQQVMQLITTIAALQQLLSVDAAKVFNFSAKFNALDGD